MTTERNNRADRLIFWFSRNKYLLGAFFISLVIMAIGYFSRGVYPIGNRDVLTIDAYHQYGPFLAELRARFQSFSSLFYSWSGGLGTNFYALLAYYVASPLNLILVLFPAAHVTEGILILILIKVGLAGACFYYYLREVHHREGPLGIALSLMYAVSSYVLSYSWNIMWLDAIYLLPLIILGEVRIVRDRRYLLYTLSLALTIASNYYMAYFVCIFAVLYFPIVLFTHQQRPRPGRVLVQTIQFGGLSLLGAGLSAILALPTYISLQLTSAADDPFPKTLVNFFELFDYIGQHFMANKPTVLDGMPNMYAGLLALILIPVYFLSRQVPLKAKFLNLSLIVIMVLSFNINMLNFIWHGFHYPNQLPYRNSFVYIFLILTLAYPALRSLREFGGKQLGLIISVLILLVLLAQKVNTKAPTLLTIYPTLAFLVIYAAVLTMDRIHRMHPADVAMALLLVVVAEILVNTLITMHNYDTAHGFATREGYTDGVEVTQIREELAQIARQDSSFYRVATMPPRTTNDGFLYQYRGLSIFASTISTKPVRLFENLGYHSNSINSYIYEGSTLVLDSIFGIKYLIRRSDFVNDTLRQQISQTSELEVYKNPYTLPLGVLGSASLAEWSSGSIDPLAAQNSLFEELGGLPEVMQPVSLYEGEQTNISLDTVGSNYYNFDRTYESQDSKISLIIDNDRDQQLYLYLDVTANEPDWGFVMIDDQRVDFNARRSTLIDLGYVSASANIVFNLTFAPNSKKSGHIELYCYGLDQMAFEQSIDLIRQSGLEITRFRDTHIEGTVTARYDGILLLSMPYDEGWTVKVDGEKVEKLAIDDALIGVELTAGEHNIDLTYMPTGFIYGLLISLGSAFILVIIYLLPFGPGRRGRLRRSALRRPDDEEQENEAETEYVTENVTENVSEDETAHETAHETAPETDHETAPETASETDHETAHETDHETAHETAVKDRITDS